MPTLRRKILRLYFFDECEFIKITLLLMVIIAASRHSPIHWPGS